MENNGKNRHKRWEARELTVMGLLAALMCASAYITIPLPFTEVGITAQTLMVNLIGMLLGPAETAAVLLVWILLGVTGVPVFSGGVGGAARLVGPTGGYIVGFLAAAVLISLFCRKVKGLGKQTAFLIAAGIPVVYFCGMSWTKITTGLPWAVLVVRDALPFVPLDVAKCFAAAALAKALRRALGR